MSSQDQNVHPHAALCFCNKKKQRPLSLLHKVNHQCSTLTFSDTSEINHSPRRESHWVKKKVPGG